jgi:CBS domain-containing protein
MHKVKVLLRNRNLVYAGPDETALDAARRMESARVGALVVLDGRRLVGVFSERDLMTRIVVPGRDPAAVPVREVMTGDVVTAHVEERRSQCIDKMKAAGCRHLPVIEDDQVVAMLSMRDLLRDEIEEQVEEIESLRAYIHQAPLA